MMGAVETMNATPTLVELADTARREHAEAEAAKKTWLEHAVAAGEALLEAKDQVPYGKWQSWVRKNTDISHATANVYMRVAVYRDDVPAGLYGCDDVKTSLRHNPTIPHLGPDTWVRQKEAAHLAERGMGQHEIADLLGVSQATVCRWLNPSRIEREKQRRLQRSREREAARQALKEKRHRAERDRAAKRAGGAVSHAYSNLRKCAADLQAAIDEADDQETAATLRAALDYAYKAEDEIVRALGVQ